MVIPSGSALDSCAVGQFVHVDSFVRVRFDPFVPADPADDRADVG